MPLALIVAAKELMNYPMDRALATCAVPVAFT